MKRAIRRVLLVDIDDTVVDWIGPAREAVTASVATHPALAGADPERLSNRFFEIVEETHALWQRGDLSPDQLRAERVRRLVAEAGSQLDPAEAAHLGAAYREAYLAARRPVPGAPNLLRAVRAYGAKVAAVTNNLVSEQEDKLRATGLRDLFDALVISEAAGVSKPDPAIFRIALEAAGSEPHEAVMLGDSWDNDVVGAIGAGISAAWLDRRGAGSPPRTDLDVLILTSLEPAEGVAAQLLGRDPPRVSSAS
jgi:HAD superfamily hydrolase (TIGR01509 family)